MVQGQLESRRRTRRHRRRRRHHDTTATAGPCRKSTVWWDKPNGEQACGGLLQHRLHTRSVPAVSCLGTRYTGTALTAVTVRSSSAPDPRPPTVRPGTGLPIADGHKCDTRGSRAVTAPSRGPPLQGPPLEGGTGTAVSAPVGGRPASSPHAEPSRHSGPPSVDSAAQQVVGTADKNIRAAPNGAALMFKKSGGVLLSHTLPSAVPSALASLATGFGM